MQYAFFASATYTHAFDPDALPYIKGRMQNFRAHGCWCILVCDSMGTDYAVYKAALDVGLPVTVYGTTKYPRNGSSVNHYQRVSLPESELTRYLVQLAARVLFVGDNRHAGVYARRLKKAISYPLAARVSQLVLPLG